MQGLQIGYRRFCCGFIWQNVSIDNKRRLMNRSSKGFGLTGVAVAVVLMFVTAVFSTSAKSAEAPTTLSVLSSVK